MSTMSLKRPSVVLSFVLALLPLSVAYAFAADSAARFDLPAESLDKALRDFAIQMHCQISYEPELVAGLNAPEIRGEYTPSAVLKLLLKGTNLRAVSVDGDMIQVVSAASTTMHVADPQRGTATNAAPRIIRVGNLGSETPRKANDALSVAVAEPAAARAKGTAANDTSLDEITVTGTHIRGASNSASPVNVYSRQDIAASGSTSVQQFLVTLPQNFGGGAGEGTVFSGGISPINATYGSGANLRGLGNNATLVLVNGHRVAPGNSSGNFVDISMIPLTAIERIEVVTDGASAIYGSDAVGGVINIILRTELDGIDTSVQYGTGINDAHRNIQIGQAMGRDWSSGSAVLSYQYFDQNELAGSSRTYSSGPQPFDLLPESVQHAAFTSLRQQLTPTIQMVGDAMYSQRRSLNRFTEGTTTIRDAAAVDGYGASLGVKVDLPRQSRLTLSQDYSESDTRIVEIEAALPPDGSPNSLFTQKIKTAISSTSINLDGVLGTIPSGVLRFAVGGQYRKETYGIQFPTTDDSSYQTSRNIASGFAEVHIPLLAPNQYSDRDPALELIAADRQEHYSDFGSTNNPSLGLVWKPLSGVRLRGSWGTSFQSPQLFQLNPIPSAAALLPRPDESRGGNCDFDPSTGQFVGGCINALVLVGGNPGLGPQKATTWTVGADWGPESLAGFTTRLTYYNTVIRDEIATAADALPTWFNVTNQNVLLGGPGIYQFNPSAKEIQYVVGQPTFTNPFNLDPATAEVLLDDRYRNLSIYRTRGLDVESTYTGVLWGRKLETGVVGTYIFDFKRQLTATSPLQSLLNKAYNPVALRLRARAVLSQGPLTGGVYLNFTKSYSNDGVTPTAPVASWTTADAFLTYAAAQGDRLLDGVSLSLNITNLAGRDPPFVKNSNSLYGTDYDGANANPLGRFISIRISKRW